MNETHKLAETVYKSKRELKLEIFFSQKTLSVKLEPSVTFDELAKCKSPYILYFKCPNFSIRLLKTLSTG